MKSIQLKEDLSNCSGCGACVAVCPRSAIKMAENYYGCVYPLIDETRCIQCGKCVGACSFHTPLTGSNPLEAFAAGGRNRALIQKSSSGGIFASVAESLVQSGGMIAGVVLEFGPDGADVFHIIGDKLEDITRIQGSKYVQSDAWRCYDAVRESLKQGRTVLFSGTPCQVAAIRKLTGDPENLVTIDLICHGVPTKQMLNGQLKCLEKRLGGRITGFSFRDKSAKTAFTAGVETKRKKYFLRWMYLSFYSMFLNASIYRESCYDCPYAGSERVSDITIGDYWGIENHHDRQIQTGEMPNRNDWSCVLVNTPKGVHFLQQHGSALELYPTKVEWIREKNRQLSSPSRRSEDREKILQRYKEKGYAAVEKIFMQKQGGVLRYYWHFIKDMKKYKGL